MPSDYLCNLVLPGAAKSGTSSLHEYLASHPAITMSASKEPHHFCREDLFARGANAHNDLFRFDPSIRYFGESSTGYLPSAKAAERVARELRAPKAIFLLRDPVERAFSHYRWRFRLGLEKRSFLEAMQIDGFGYDPNRPTRFGYMAYLEFSQYARQVPVWEDALGADACLSISAESLRCDHAGTMARCFAFLDLEPTVDTDSASAHNETDAQGRYTSNSLTMLARMLPNGFKSSRLYQSLRRRILHAGAPIPPATMTAQERTFAETALAEDITWFQARFTRAGNF